MPKENIAIVGAGPAGLIAAEMLAKEGLQVTIYERKASPARKFLMAGRGGLNITHSESLDQFIPRYGAAQNQIGPMIAHGFTPQDLREWCHGLGEETFIGSSGRVFPKSFKASPLLRVWLQRLDRLGVRIEYQMTWTGWTNQNELRFVNKSGEEMTVSSDAVLLALGGASWPNLGSDGSWVSILRDKHIAVSDLKAANCGFVCRWSELFQEQFSGQPLKGISITHKDRSIKGEIMIDRRGVEGGAVYALSSSIRSEIEDRGAASISIDLRPSLDTATISKSLSIPRAKKTLSNFLRSVLSMSALEINLLREAYPNLQGMTVSEMSDGIKNISLTLTEAFPIDKSISSAGGICFSELGNNLMIQKMPGVFAAGEMLDWEAPTGGYLLQGCFASGTRAAAGILEYLNIPMS